MNLLVHWVGGKSRVVPKLKELMPEKYNDYYEPFLGSGALAFSLTGKRYLSDLNHRLITMYNVVRDYPQEVVDLIKVFDNTEEEYYKVRDLFNTSHNPLSVAAYFIYLNKRGFNGLYRENSKGKFNVPWGRNKKNINYNSILEMSRHLKDVDIKCMSYDAITPKEGDFVYIDPPYVGNFNGYVKETFDHQKLKEFIDKLTNNGVMVMFSNSIHAEELYKDYNIHYVEVGRQVCSDSIKRGKVKEIIGTNY